MLCRYRDEGRVDIVRQCVHGGQAGKARDLVVARVDRMDRAGEAELAQVTDDAKADRVLALRSADDRDGARLEQPLERVAHGCGSGMIHRSLDSQPRPTGLPGGSIGSPRLGRVAISVSLLPTRIT